MKRGRPIGAHIREIVAIAEQLGSCTCPQIRAHMQAPMELSNVWKYCSRAVGLGLLAVDRSVRPTRYRPVEGRPDMVESGVLAQQVHQPAAAPVTLDADGIVATALRTQASSVFALGRVGTC